MWAWGSNIYGALGDGTTTYRNAPVAVIGLSNVVAVAAGDYHSVALTSDGRVWTWGRNSSGQLGDGTTTLSKQPLIVSTTITAAAIAAGADHTLIVKTDQTVWGWGANGFGQLGDGSTTQRTLPAQMTDVTGAIRVAGGANHSLVLKSDGTARATGYNQYGQLGDGTWTQRTVSVAVSGLTTVSAIAAGSHHSYAVLADGTVRGWGIAGYGQIGDGSTTNRNSPVQISAVTGVTMAAAGHQHGLAVTGSEVVWTWGQNSAGQLGDGTNQSRSTPVAISGPGYAWKVGTPVFNVASGTYTTEKTVVVTSATPGAVIHYTLDGSDPTEADSMIASGSSVVIDQSSTLKARAWKIDMAPSEIGAATYTLAVSSLVFSPSGGTYTTPKTVSITSSTPGATIRYTLDGSTPSETSALYSAPLNIGTSTTVKAVGTRTNWNSSAVATATYTMNFGTLTAPVLTPGTGTYTSEAVVVITAAEGATIRYTTNGATPTASSIASTGPVTIGTTTTIKAKAFRPDYTTSVESSGTYTIVVAAPELAPTSGTYQAGQAITMSTATAGATMTYTLNGQDPIASDPAVPAGSAIVMGNFTLKVKAWKAGATASGISTATYQVAGTVTPRGIFGGNIHSLFVRDDSLAWSWGANTSGQLGDGTTTRRTLPVIVAGLTGTVVMAAGDTHSLAVRTDGTVLAWGSNGNGRLGDGTTTQRLVPIVVPALTDVVVAAAGTSHSLALLNDGTVRAWGYNTSGQLGDGTTTERLSPVTLATLSNITAMAARANWSLALRSDGTAWSWGANGNGQLGDGTLVGKSSPVQVGGVSTAGAIDAGSAHGLALLADSTVKSWGWNAYGQLGDGTQLQRTTAVAVSNLTDVSKIAAGGYHSLALKADGTVWSWGSNAHGQLGDGTTTNRSTAVQVFGLTDIVDVAGGTYHSLAIAGDGSVWAWGRNADGQLGDGTQDSRSLPVQIAGPDVAWKITAPVLSLASGTYFSSQTVTVTCGDADAVLHYTVNGQNPVPSDPVIGSGGSVPIDQSLILKVRAWKPGAVSSEIVIGDYQLKVVAPALTPASGAYGAPQAVSMTTGTPGATITYTLDGTEPAAASTSYAAPMTVSETGSVKARAYKAGWTASDSAAASYWISAGAVATPTIEPEGGTFAQPPLVRLTCATAAATIRYTLDGTEPTAASPLYEFPFLIETSATLKARAFRTGYAPSAAAFETFSLDLPGQTGVATVAPRGGFFATAQTIQITGPAGAVLRYTTTGVDPSETDATVPAGGLVQVNQSAIVKVRAWLDGSTPSAVTRADFVITGAVAAGDQHSLGLASDGSVWAWGRNTEGQVGDSTGISTASPISVLTDAIAIAGGKWHSIAVRGDGSVWAWGSNGSGRLGDGTGTTRFSPVQASGVSDVIAAAAGEDHSLALKRDGTVWAWGNNQFGQLGDGTTTNRSTPVQVIGLTGVTSIAAGEDFSIAVQSDGAAGGLVWTWGRNDTGQLGDGSVLARSIPVRVVEIGSAVEAVAGEAFALVRLADGTLRGWGANDQFQLGMALGAMATSPAQVLPINGTCAIAAGLRHALSVGCNGRVWAWGYNSGQLGMAPIFSPSPLYVPDSREVLAVASGWLMTLQLRADGTVWASGTGVGTGLPPGHHYQFEPLPGFSLASNAWLLADSDADGLANWEEYAAGTDPLRGDTNGNGLSDLLEVRRGARGGNPDDDGDGVSNALEQMLGTDPFRTDTDGDGVSDLADAYPLDPTRSQKPAPDPTDTTPPAIILTLPASARPLGGGGQ